MNKKKQSILKVKNPLKSLRRTLRWLTAARRRKFLYIPLKSFKFLYHWFTATRRRKILSSFLALLILLSSIRFIFFSPKEVEAATMKSTVTTKIRSLLEICLQ